MNLFTVIGTSIVAICFSLSAFAAGNDITSENIGLTCKKTKAPLFKTDQPFKPLPVDIMTDYKELNAGRSDEQFKAVVTFPGESGMGPDFIPVLLEQRGNSRRTYCEFKPLRVVFLDPSIEAEIEAKLEVQVPQDASINEYRKAYYKALVGMEIGEEKIGKSQDDNMFDKIGDDVKISTHCGKSRWEPIGGETLGEQDRRVFEEHLIYQILSTLKTTTFNTRLSQFTYRGVDGKPYFEETRPGFWREPKGEVADRCKFDDEEISIPDTASESSKIQAETLLKFAYQNDFGFHGEGHNVAISKNKPDETRKFRFYIPYDFDLSGVSNPNYFKNRGQTLEQNADSLYQYLSSLNESNTKVALGVAQKINKKTDKFKKFINSSYLSDDRKIHFNKWVDTHTTVTNKFINDQLAVQQQQEAQ